jgi:hypothetical protein
MDSEHFPHKQVLQELYWRDLYFFNYHINHDKMAWFYESFEPAAVHRHEDHFTFWDPDHYQLATVELGSGSATEMVTPDIPCGVLAIVNAAADGDYDEVFTQCTWAFAKGHPLFFEMRVGLDDGEECDAYVGFLDAPLYSGQPREGFYFRKDDGDRNVDFVVMTGGVATVVDTILNCEDRTWARLCAHWDGDRTIRWFAIDDTSGLILFSGEVTAGFTAGQLLYFAWGVRNGEAAAKSMYVDYIKIAQKLYVADDLPL